MQSNDEKQSEVSSAGPLAVAANADAKGEASQESLLAELKSKLPHLHRYHTAQLKEVREHIEKYFGKIYLQVEDVKEDGLHIDIDIIKADKDKGIPNNLLVTKGMGAYRMQLPESLVKDLENSNDGGCNHLYERCELYMSLPEDANLESERDEDSWPITMLNVFARLPYIYNSWIGPGHVLTFDDENAPGTKFEGAMILPMQPHKCEYQAAETSESVCILPGDTGKVSFYRVVPLFAEELAYIEEYSVMHLLRCMTPDAFIADPKRPLTHLRKFKRKTSPSNASDSQTTASASDSTTAASEQ